MLIENQKEQELNSLLIFWVFCVFYVMKNEKLSHADFSFQGFSSFKFFNNDLNEKLLLFLYEEKSIQDTARFSFNLLLIFVLENKKDKTKLTSNIKNINKCVRYCLQNMAISELKLPQNGSIEKKVLKEDFSKKNIYTNALLNLLKSIEIEEKQNIKTLNDLYLKVEERLKSGRSKKRKRNLKVFLFYNFFFYL